MDAIAATLVVPFLFQGRVTGFLTLGPKRNGLGYSSQDLGLLRLLANSSALALEHSRAYTALQETNAELRAALRRVEILESIRTNLAKFVPRTVQDLIERAPEAPEFDKRETDVTVLFVDLVGYTRLTERLDPGRVNEVVERCFGAYLDEILRRGGDVNETAGDGLMAIFRDPDPRRHARQAVKCALGILRRTRELNETLDGLPEPVAIHSGVNSGLATVGATKIEGMNGTRWTYTASGQVTIVAARSGRARPGGRDPGGRRHPRAAGGRIPLRVARRAPAPERRATGARLPAGPERQRSCDPDRLSPRGSRSSAPFRSARRPQPRAIDQNAAPK